MEIGDFQKSEREKFIFHQYSKSSKIIATAESIFRPGLNFNFIAKTSAMFAFVCMC